MQRKITLMMLLMLISISLLAQKGVRITGKWLHPGGQGQVEIYKKGSGYNGKIVWIKTPYDKTGKPLRDQKNLILSLRERPILGLEVLKHCTYNGNTYEGGTIYDPQSGKSYSCKMVLKGDLLKVCGYIGMFLGRTETWTRVK